MTRIVVIVEGPTEESFVSGPLAEALWPSQVLLTPIVLGVVGHKGGNTNYARVQRDICRQLKQDRTAICSTMIDYYGLGGGFPGTPAPSHLSNVEKVRHIEKHVFEDILNRIPDLQSDVRFVPYLALHEYEALLFSDPEAFAEGINQPALAAGFHNIRNEFDSPADINDDPLTAPSKRILSVCPGYRKVIQGTQAARAVGIAKMREECEHFREWFQRLERFGTANPR